MKRQILEQFWVASGIVGSLFMSCYSSFLPYPQLLNLTPNYQQQPPNLMNFALGVGQVYLDSREAGRSSSGEGQPSRQYADNLQTRRSSVTADRQQLSQLIVSLSEAKVYVQQGKQVIASYPVAVGRAGHDTPTGTFQVTDMQENPTWQNPQTGEIVPPSPSNPIGDRWIEFIRLPNGNRIGFHGTNQESSIGQAVSNGCLRMRKADLHKLFLQTKIGTKVIVKH